MGKTLGEKKFFGQIWWNVWRKLCFVGGIDLTPSISVLTRGRGAHHVDQQVIRGFRNYLFVVFDAVILSLLLMLFLLLFRPGAEVPIRRISRWYGDYENVNCLICLLLMHLLLLLLLALKALGPMITIPSIHPTQPTYRIEDDLLWTKVH